MNEAVKKFVESRWVKNRRASVASEGVCSLSQQLTVYKRAGFTRKAEQVKQQINKLKSRKGEIDFFQKFRDRIILKMPVYRIKVPSDETVYKYVFGLWSAFIGLSIVLASVIGSFEMAIALCFGSFFVACALTMIILPHSGVFRGIHLKGKKYLVKSEIAEYGAHIPLELAQKTTQIREAELKPEIWSVTEVKGEESLRNLVQRSNLDPLLVGRYNSEYVVLYAVWGEDIEDLDRAFSAGGKLQ